MFDYIDGMLKELSDGWLEGPAATPTAIRLFEVNNEAKKLPKDNSLLYHHNMAKLLFPSNRARPDAHKVGAFMWTRLTRPDVDNLKKLKWVLRYLKIMKYSPLTIEVDGGLYVFK